MIGAVRGDFALDGRTALVTGAGSGMGRATSLLLAERGATVIATDLDGETAKETAEQIADAGGHAHAAKVDVGDYDEVARELARLATEVAPIDIAISCAGIGSFNAVADVAEDEIDSVLAVSLGGTYAVTRAVLPGMRERGFGRLIGFASLNGKTPPPGLAHYSAAKAAIVGFTQAVALEVAPEVTVNCVSPGMIDTPIMLEDLEFARRTDPDVTLEQVIATAALDVPAGRLGQPEEVAQMVAYLASDQAAFITGQAFNVSGGQEMG
jgi:NAD(P)-dependent dehydrogenase (short-subunit alcohol dehydrogenase family)